MRSFAVLQIARASAFQYGIRFAIIASAFIGPIVANILQYVAGRLKRMKVISPESYYQINEITKYTIFISIIGAVIYNYLSQEFSFEITYLAIIFFLTSLMIAIAYVQLKVSRSNKRTLSSSNRSVLFPFCPPSRASPFHSLSVLVLVFVLNPIPTTTHPPQGPRHT